MKYKALGYIFIAAVMAATVSLLYYQNVKNSVPENVLLPVHKSGTAGWETLDGQTFELSYPQKYTVDPSDQSGQNYFAHGETLSTIEIPGSEFPNTNFVSGSVTVAKSAANNAADCKKYVSGAGSKKPLDKSERINGLGFDKAEFTGAAAGNLYETRLYRIFHGRSCYEVSLTLHMGNIGNYEPGTVAEVNEGTVWTRLMQILNTFKFNEDNKDTVFCGGFAGTPCPPSGYICKSEGSYPDAGTICTKNQTTGTLTGHVTVGPICPVERVGESCPVPPTAYTTRQVGVFTQATASTPEGSTNAKLIASQYLDTNGNYSFDLPAGSYVVNLINWGFGNSTGDLPKTITIKPNATITLDFNIDTGIR